MLTCAQEAARKVWRQLSFNDLHLLQRREAMWSLSAGLCRTHVALLQHGGQHTASGGRCFLLRRHGKRVLAAHLQGLLSLWGKTTLHVRIPELHRRRRKSARWDAGRRAAQRRSQRSDSAAPSDVGRRKATDCACNRVACCVQTDHTTMGVKDSLVANLVADRGEQEVACRLAAPRVDVRAHQPCFSLTEPFSKRTALLAAHSRLLAAVYRRPPLSPSPAPISSIFPL